MESKMEPRMDDIVTHREYTSTASVQVMIFADRLEVWNPGTLPPRLTPARLRKPHGSVPCNPLLAEPLYLTKYIERMGTGTGDMIRRCRNVGLDEPGFALTDGFVVTIRRKPELAFKAVGGMTGEVTGEVQRLLTVMVGEMKRTDIQEALALRHEDYFREAYLLPALTTGVIEMTIPGKPTSSKQRYRLTPQGRNLIAKLAKEAGDDDK
jgi:ATP-dependent DNA helicase RecG